MGETKPGKQLEKFLENLLEEVRGKTVGFKEKWRGLSREGRGLLEKVVGGLVRRQGREKWCGAVEEMGLVAPPVVKISKNTAVVEFPGSKSGVDYVLECQWTEGQTPSRNVGVSGSG